MTTRFRLVSIHVQLEGPEPHTLRVKPAAWDQFASNACISVHLEAFTDDGDELTPLPLQPLRVRLADWEEFAAIGFPKALAALKAQVEPSSAPEPHALQGLSLEVQES